MCGTFAIVADSVPFFVRCPNSYPYQFPAHRLQTVRGNGDARGLQSYPRWCFLPARQVRAAHHAVRETTPIHPYTRTTNNAKVPPLNGLPARSCAAGSRVPIDPLFPAMDDDPSSPSHLPCVGHPPPWHAWPVPPAAPIIPDATALMQQIRLT